MDAIDCCTEKSWGRLGTIVMTITSLLTPLTVLFYNPRYLVSMTGFADGGDMYSHFAEAVHVKEQMENGVFNFWFDQVSLGYPMFTAYQPLPCFFIASMMTVFQRLMTPQLVFRLIFVIVLTLIPASVYQSSKILGLRPLHGASLCLLTFAIQSWRKFGLEISAFIEYGLLTQAFGMLLLFPLVSVLYRWIIIEDCQKETSTLPVILLAVTFLSNFFFGIYACVLSAAMLLVKIRVKIANRECSSICCLVSKVQSFACMHVHCLLLISWWIIACLWSYDYVGGLPWRGESEDGYPLSTVLERFTEGEVFDSNRFFPWLTILVILGITLHAFNLSPKELCIGSRSEEDRVYSSWLMLSSLLSLILFLGRTTFSVFYNLIPLHSELEAIKYLNALHFCGLLHASYAITELFRLVADALVAKLPIPMTPNDCTARRCKECCCIIGSVKTHATSIREKIIAITSLLREHKTTVINSVLLLSVAAVLWCNQCLTVATHVTMAEVDQTFISRLKQFRNGTVPGRIFGHRALGTASTFDLAFIPMYTGKPGLLTYSRGYHDSLSVFYMESLQFNPDRTDIFASTLRLYNVHYVVTSSTKLDGAFMNACKMKQIAKIDDLMFYEVLHEDPDYGYFDFIRIPGRIQGELKLIRQAVLKLIELFNTNSLLMMNPDDSLDVTDDVIVDVRGFGFWESWRNFTQQKVHVTWTLKGQEIDSELLLDEILKGNSWKWIYSQVMEERVDGIEYQAVVHVADHGKQPTDQEHLLLKVTYHPFWRCYFYPVSDHFLLDRFDHARLLDGKVYTQINHVTPNLMSVTLPPGRHLVVFTYRFPGILKILTMVCGIFFAKMLRDYLLYCKNETSDQQGETVPHEKEKEVEVFIDMHSRNRQHQNWSYGTTASVAPSAEKMSHKILDASRRQEEKENNNDSEKVKTMKVGGARIRSLSIAAKNMFKNYATNFASTLQIPKVDVSRISLTEESGEWIDTSGRDIDPANIRSSTSCDEMISDGSREKVCSHMRRSLSDSELRQYSHESVPRKGNLSAREMPSTTISEDDHINGRKSQNKIKSILSRKGMDEEEDSVMNLRDRLRRLCADSPPDKWASEGQDRPQHMSGIVQQLRQNYLKERRTTLANVPNLRKR